MKIAGMSLSQICFLVVTFLVCSASMGLYAASSSSSASKMNPPDNSFNKSGYDKHSDALWNMYQQKRMGVQTPATAGKPKDAGKTSTPTSKLGSNRAPIKKIAFKSATPAPAQGQPIKPVASTNSRQK